MEGMERRGLQGGSLSACCRCVVFQWVPGELDGLPAAQGSDNGRGLMMEEQVSQETRARRRRCDQR